MDILSPNVMRVRGWQGKDWIKAKHAWHFLLVYSRMDIKAQAWHGKGRRNDGTDMFPIHSSVVFGGREVFCPKGIYPTGDGLSTGYAVLDRDQRGIRYFGIVR